MSPSPSPFVAGWWDAAACMGSGGRWFSEDPEQVALAKETCATCPVRTECLAHAYANDEPWGIWGGLTPEERGQPRPFSRRSAFSKRFFKSL